MSWSSLFLPWTENKYNFSESVDELKQSHDTDSCEKTGVSPNVCNELVVRVAGLEVYNIIVQSFKVDGQSHKVFANFFQDLVIIQGVYVHEIIPEIRYGK